jgi:hypothetical protein
MMMIDLKLPEKRLALVENLPPATGAFYLARRLRAVGASRLVAVR